MLENQEKLKIIKNSEKKQKIIFDIAKKFGGETTISDFYANSDLSVDEIEQILAQLSTKNCVESKLNEKNNIIKFIFPDIRKNYFNEKRNLAEKAGIDKLILRIKYRKFREKPIADLEKAILQTAQEFSGKLTISNIVEYTGLSIEEAEAVLSSLSAKGLCRKEMEQDIINHYYNFHEIVETSQNKQIEEPQKKIFGFSQELPKKILKNIRKNTDKYIIKNKVKRFRFKAKKNLFMDTVLPGIGHLSDQRWGLAEYLLFSIIPFFLTCGLSYIPEMIITRYRTFKFYNITENKLRERTLIINRNSVIYGVVLTLFYIRLIGISGISIYYNYLLKLLLGM
jgi:predicted transcriptional regulator